MNTLLNKKVIEILTFIKHFFYLVFSFLVRIIYLLIIISIPAFILYKWNFAYAEHINAYLKTIIWPVIAMFFIIKFEPEIRKKIEEMVKAKTPAGDYEFKQRQQIESENETKIEKKSEAKNIESNDPEILKKEIEVKNKKIEEERKLGFSYYLKHRYEWGYRVIFGSQLSILLALELANNNIMSYEAVHKIYETSEFHPSYSFTEYIGFLLSFGFVKFDGINNTYTLNNIGHEFLDYLRKEKLPFNKKPY